MEGEITEEEDYPNLLDNGDNHFYGNQEQSINEIEENNNIQNNLYQE